MLALKGIKSRGTYPTEPCKMLNTKILLDTTVTFICLVNDYV